MKRRGQGTEVKDAPSVSMPDQPESNQPVSGPVAEFDKLASKKKRGKKDPNFKVSKIIGKRLRHPEFVRLYLAPLKSDTYADKVMQQLVAERADKDEKFNKAVTCVKI